MQLLKSISENLDNFLIRKKLDSVPGYILILSLAVFLGWIMTKQFLLGAGIIGLGLGVFVIMLCLLNPELGFYIAVFYSFIAFDWVRLIYNDTFPVGTLSDLFVAASFLGLFVGMKKKKEVPPSRVFNVFLLLYGYYLLQFFNTNALQFAGWFQNLRKITAEFMILYTAYNLFTTYDKVRRFLIFLFVILVLVGFYGCIQQWHGLFEYSLLWVVMDEARFNLIFVDGNFRKFSTINDPTSFGLIMAGGALFYSVIALTHRNKWVTRILFSGVIIMVLGMAYSGTRTANAMFVAGVCFYIMLTINKRSTQIFAGIAALVFVFIMYAPIYGNATINRFRTTFKATDDPSFNVRVLNRAFIQPYIHSHPIGGGLGTSGPIGMKNVPHHPLALFATDGGYVKYAVELGWIGLALVCFSYFVIIRNVIREYFAATNAQVKTLMAACGTFLFSFYVAQYAQDSLGQLADIVVYFPFIAFTLRADKLSESLNKLPA